MRRVVRRGAMALGASLVMAALLPSYIRAYTVFGDSDAPAYLFGDRVLVNLAAFDIRIPYSDRVLMRLGDPTPGDVILLRGQDGRLAMKRVVAGPGARVAMQDNHLMVDGRPIHYRVVPEQERSRISRGSLGSSLELEQGNGPQVYVSYSPGIGPYSSFDPTEVPAGMFFLLGSNRDLSVDSRVLGPVPRGRILGRVVGHAWTAE